MSDNAHAVPHSFKTLGDLFGQKKKAFQGFF